MLADPLERVVGLALHLGQPRALQLWVLYGQKAVGSAALEATGSST